MTEDISESEQIAYLLRLNIKDGQRAAFETLCIEAIAATRADPNAMNYELFMAGDTFHSFEKFSDSAATLAHLGWFSANLADRVLAVADIAGLTVYGSPSDELREAFDAMGATYQRPVGGFAR